MKKFIVACAFFLCAGLAGQAGAQTGISFGVKANASLSKFNMSGTGIKSDLKAGGSAGGFMDIAWGEYFSLRPELLLDYRTSKLKQSGNSDTFKYWGVELPVYALVRFGAGNGKIFMGAGPYVSYGFSAKTGKTNWYKKQQGETKPAMSRFDFGAGAVAGYEFGSGFLINAGYQIALIDNLKANKKNATMKPRILTLGVGYKF